MLRNLAASFLVTVACVISFSPWGHDAVRSTARRSYHGFAVLKGVRQHFRRKTRRDNSRGGMQYGEASSSSFGEVVEMQSVRSGAVSAIPARPSRWPPG